MGKELGVGVYVKSRVGYCWCCVLDLWGSSHCFLDSWTCSKFPTIKLTFYKENLKNL